MCTRRVFLCGHNFVYTLCGSICYQNITLSYVLWDFSVFNVSYCGAYTPWYSLWSECCMYTLWFHLWSECHTAVCYVMFAVAKASHFGVYTLRFPLCSKWVGLWEITLSPTMLSIPWFILGPITFPGASSLSLSLCFHSPTLFHHFSRVCNFLKLYRVLSGKDVSPIVFVFFYDFTDFSFVCKFLHCVGNITRVKDRGQYRESSIFIIDSTMRKLKRLWIFGLMPRCCWYWLKTAADELLAPSIIEA